jgi:hypothetical protein
MGHTEKGAKWQLLNTMPVMEVDKETIFSLVRLDTLPNRYVTKNYFPCFLQDTPEQYQGGQLMISQALER